MPQALPFLFAEDFLSYEIEINLDYNERCILNYLVFFFGKSGGLKLFSSWYSKSPVPSTQLFSI